MLVLVTVSVSLVNRSGETGNISADILLVGKQTCCLVEARERFVFGQSFRGETRDNSADSMLVREQKCCLVEAIAWWEATQLLVGATGNNSIGVEDSSLVMK